MEHHARWLDWSSNPIAERMSFSSFSHSVDDIWGYDEPRPYQIVLLPGYRVPTCLDRGDKDALWYHKEEVHDRAVIVWDGYSPTALFEIIRECFDYEGTCDRIAVREAETGKRIADDRDPSVMALRPVRKAGWGPKQIHNHIAELLVWSGLFPSGNETSEIYSEMLIADGYRRQDTVDSYERAQLFIQRGMRDVKAYENHQKLLAATKAGKIRIHRACKYGTPAGVDKERAARDAEVGLIDTSYNGMSELGRIHVNDFAAGRPESFYRFALSRGQSELQEMRRAAAINNPPSQPEPDRGGEETKSDRESLFGRFGGGKPQAGGSDRNPF